MRIKDHLYSILGFITLVLAYIGVITPGIPGIPFILLTAFFFFRSSPKRYKWLKDHKIFGKILSKFAGDNKISWKLKLFVISQLWVSVFVAFYFFVKDDIVRGIIISIVLALCILFWKLDYNFKDKNS